VGPLVAFPRTLNHESIREVAAFAFWPSTAHDEDMGEACERCGRLGEPCSIHDPTISGKWKTLILCDQCRAAIRQRDARACKWFRRYCAPRNPAPSLFKQPVTRETKTPQHSKTR